MRPKKQPNENGCWCCSNCKNWLPADKFNKNKQQTSGLDHKCRECSKTHTRHYNYKSKYNITVVDYEKLYQKQSGKCAICETFCSVLCVDHNHATGQVRGLLCPRCNLALGNLLDSSEQALLCARYLKTWNC